jgi:hypothetical protein
LRRESSFQLFILAGCQGAALWIVGAGVSRVRHYVETNGRKKN